MKSSMNSSIHAEESSILLSQGEEERDEIQEVQRYSQKDTNRIRVWRFVIATVLLTTALAVTVTTHDILAKDQKRAFNEAFSKFSRTLGDAALLQQKIMLAALKDISQSLSIDAVRTNQTWPYYNNPFYETSFGAGLAQAKCELTALFNMVEGDSREDWIEFAGDNLEEWAHAGHMHKYGNLSRLVNETTYIPDMIQKVNDSWIPDKEWYEYWPMWLYSPPPAQYGAVNWNLINVPDYEAIVNASRQIRGEAVITLVRKSVSTGTAFTDEEHEAMHSELKTGSLPDHPHSFIWMPVYEDPEDVNSKFVAILATNFAWDVSLRNLMPDTVAGVIVIIANNCNQSYTYEVSGGDALFIGVGDLHEPKYNKMKVTRNLSLLKNPRKDEIEGHCQYYMDIYPSSTFEASYDDNTPEVFAGVVAATFFCIALVMIIYDFLVARRNCKLVEQAARSNAVVASLFPSTMRDRVLEQRSAKGKMKVLLEGGGQGFDTATDEPLADLFLDSTIMFADITGFTAWSSVREPGQVFTLLEKVYASFDANARNRRIFKVETVGDCYVAAAGIPHPRKDHAVAMVHYAQDCIKSMKTVTRQLERTLGPGTGGLGIRVGIHSGPVTAGVLRGERARFQLFGDTMNTTARVEHAGSCDRIHVSQATATHLKIAGKEHWLVSRESLFHAKGKGMMETYWVEPTTVLTNSVTGSERNLPDQLDEEATKGDKDRLIDWNVEVLSTLIKRIVARQMALGTFGGKKLNSAEEANSGSLPLDGVKEIITLPEFDTKLTDKHRSPRTIKLDVKVLIQLRDYVTAISNLYYPNAFHNFEHASHVTMSVIKLMSRIVAPQDDELATHDADHRGIPNTQLAKENQALAKHYAQRSVAEQNSFDIAWTMLMDEHYKDLLSTLCTSMDEMMRLRELVVNGVMATDIGDKELKALRNGRWNKAFSKDADACSRETVNRKATIVIEHLIQASDVSHTMQHWHVYRKWNECLFEELYRAYKDGRGDTDPCDFWYEGEIGFFECYIIPLAKKLKDCGVFGVSSGEFLNYAEMNLDEWRRRGHEVVAEMKEKLTQQV